MGAQAGKTNAKSIPSNNNFAIYTLFAFISFLPLPAKISEFMIIFNKNIIHYKRTISKFFFINPEECILRKMNNWRIWWISREA